MRGKQNCFVESGKIEVLLDFVAGKLTPQAVLRVQEHAGDCPECQTFIARQGEVWAALDGDPAPAVSEDFNARLYARISEAEAEGWWTRKWRWLSVQMLPSYSRPAMALSIALTVVLGVTLTRGTGLDTPVSPSHAVVVQTADVDAIEETLSDLEMLQALGELPRAL